MFMRRKRALFVLIASIPLLGAKFQYPPAPRGNVVDDYNGIRVPDPYRWLENPDNPHSRKWIQEENALTASYLSTVPNTGKIKAELTGLWSPVMYPPGELAERNGRYFFLRRDPGRNQPILYWMNGRNSTPKVLLDPNTLTLDGTAALDSWSVSRDGKILAYGIARAGSDWQDIHFRAVDNCKDRSDKLEWSKFSPLEWSLDGDGIYYTRFPKPKDNELLTAANYNQQLRFHKLGEAQDRDALIYQRPDHKDWEFEPQLSENGRYLIIHVTEGTKPQNLVFYQDLQTAPGKTIEINKTFDAEYRFLDNRGTKFYFRSTNGALKGRVITIDVAARNAIAEVIPEKRSVLDQAVLLGDFLYLNYQEDVVAHLFRRPLGGGDLQEIKLPGKGTAEWADKGPKHGEQFFWYGSFTQPASLYTLDSAPLRTRAFGQSKLPIDPAAFETRQVFYASKDGTKIPMFLIGRKGFEARPETPCLLWGYGGFNISLTPQYSPLYLQWVQMGGLVAVANLRGGGEYGEAWHQAGMKLKKQNVFDDFISGAEWLIAQHYTSKSKLAIYGRSNGGLLIGAVVNQRPDLFGAAIAGVGVMDMLRFDKFTVGNGWTSDFGSPANPIEFRAIRAYSPLQNIHPGTHYPPILVLTADHDDRVVPGHSFKYTAAMQYAQAGTAPILIRIETSAGHGGGKPITKQVDEAAAIIGFLEKALGMV